MEGKGTTPLDVDHLRRWIGAEEVAADVLTASLAQRFHATLGLAGDPPCAGEPAARLIHFCLCQPAVPTAGLGEDGHPARGGFLPPVPLPRRMWAGSDVRFTGDLRVGEQVERRSRIADVAVKSGRTGTLCFVTVDHQVAGEAGVVIEDRQTIVYRALESAPAVATAPEPAPTGDTAETIVPSAALLFRYSALTFNAHRIHYDLPYASGVEGYAGLVVHGPLQATLLLHLAARQRDGHAPDRFSFRSQSPLFAPEPMTLHAGALADGAMSLWSARPGGPVAMQAQARWD